MIELPAGLHGAYSRAELEAEIGRGPVRAVVRRGVLVAYSRSVLVDYRSSADFHTRAAAAQLYAGSRAALTGLTTLALGGIPCAADAPVEVLVPYSRKLRAKPGLVVHHGWFTEADLITESGLRTVEPSFALAEVLSRERDRTGLACADQVLARYAPEDRERFRAAVERRLEERRDARGTLRARYLLDLATGVPESPAESWTLLLIADAGFPPPQPQVSVVDLAGREVYRLDWAWPEQRVAVEYDGYEAHEGREMRDAARDDDLRRRGWLVVRLTSADLGAPARFLRELTAALACRGLAA